MEEWGLEGGRDPTHRGLPPGHSDERSAASNPKQTKNLVGRGAATASEIGAMIVFFFFFFSFM